MKRKELSKTLKMIINWKKTFGLHGYNEIPAFKLGLKLKRRIRCVE